jgi:Asp/Glu/hydantoin racemase
MRLLWQGFTDPVEHKPYVDRLVAYANEIAGPGVTWEFNGVSPPDRHLHRISEDRCAMLALANVVAREHEFDAVLMGHFQDAGLWNARAALDVPVVGLGESAMLHACTLGWRVGLVTIDPIFVPWHEEQVRQYGLQDRVVGVTAMQTSLDLYMRAFEREEDAEEVWRQFQEAARPLVAAGVEVLVPAGGLPALLLGRDGQREVDGAVVLNASAVAAKQTELAAELRRVAGTAPSRRGTFAKPPRGAVEDLVALARSPSA